MNLALFVHIQNGAQLKAQSVSRNMNLEFPLEPFWIFTRRLSAFVRVSAADMSETPVYAGAARL